MGRAFEGVSRMPKTNSTRKVVPVLYFFKRVAVELQDTLGVALVRIPAGGS